MVDIKPILRIAPTVQSLALAGNALRLVKKKRKRSSDFIKTGAQTIVGTAFVAEESSFINSI